MDFEPKLPAPFDKLLFNGEMQAIVTDPHGLPVPTIISLSDDWHLTVTWEVHGGLVPLLAGTWRITAYLESMGPGKELKLVLDNVPIDGSNNYSKTYPIGPHLPKEEGPYKLVTVITSLAPSGKPGIFASHVEGPMLQFYEA